MVVWVWCHSQGGVFQKQFAKTHQVEHARQAERARQKWNTTAMTADVQPNQIQPNVQPKQIILHMNEYQAISRLNTCILVFDTHFLVDEARIGSGIFSCYSGVRDSPYIAPPYGALASTPWRIPF